jgi:hypothetical protein
MGEIPRNPYGETPTAFPVCSGSEGHPNGVSPLVKNGIFTRLVLLIP